MIFYSCTIKSEITQNQFPNNSILENDHNMSTVSQISSISKKISFVPNVNEIMTYIDVDCSFDELDHSQDISLNFKHDLDSCLKKLRTEAQELLALSAQRIPKRLSILGSGMNIYFFTVTIMYYFTIFIVIYIYCLIINIL